jgi:hypothetical protein
LFVSRKNAWNDLEALQAYLFAAPVSLQNGVQIYILIRKVPIQNQFLFRSKIWLQDVRMEQSKIERSNWNTDFTDGTDLHRWKLKKNLFNLSVFFRNNQKLRCMTEENFRCCRGCEPDSRMSTEINTNQLATLRSGIPRMTQIPQMGFKKHVIVAGAAG